LLLIDSSEYRYMLLQALINRKDSREKLEMNRLLTPSAGQL